MRFRAFPFAVLLALLTGTPAFLSAQTATFDGLPQASYGAIPGAYSGFNWFDQDGAFGSGDNLQYTTDALSGVACHSTPNCAYNAWGNSVIRIESLGSGTADMFSISGFMGNQGFPGFAGGATQVQIDEFLGLSATPFKTLVFPLSSTPGYTPFSFAGDYNKILITPLDVSGTPFDFAPFAPSDGYVMLDDITFGSAAGNVTPEPATLTLLATGLVGLAARRRKRRA